MTTRMYVRLRVADVLQVLESLGLAGARIDGARFNYTKRGLPCGDEIKAEVEASRLHIENARTSLLQLLTEGGGNN
jgi:hypothetical protein